MSAKWGALAAVFTLCIGMGVESACAAVPIAVSPGNPTPVDSIRVTVRGVFPTHCWNDLPATCATAANDTLAVTVPAPYCGCDCEYFERQYSQTCNFGLLSAGVYVVKFTELHTTVGDRIPTSVATLSFTISDPTPVFHRSWGALKSSYR